MDTSGFHALVRRAQQGDRAAMDDVLAVLRPHLQMLARPYADPSRPVESTSDLLQESCLRAWNKIGSFEGGTDDGQTFAMFRSWVGQIVRRLGANAQRDRKAQKRRPEGGVLSLDAPIRSAKTGEPEQVEPFAREESPSVYARAGERSDQLRAALDALEDQEGARIVRMHVVEGMPLTEVAERMQGKYREVRERFLATLQQLESDLGGRI